MWKSGEVDWMEGGYRELGVWSEDKVVMEKGLKMCRLVGDWFE